MKVDIFTLRFGGGKSFCAQVEGEKITVADAFDVLSSGELPVFLGMCSLEARMQFDRGEEGTKRIRISFIDEDGRPAVPSLDANIDVEIPDQVQTATVPFALMLKQLSLPAFGQYSVELAVDGRLQASTRLYARQKA